MVYISMPRGDLHSVVFPIIDEYGNIADVEITEIYFTVKNAYNLSTVLFQKKLSTGQIQLTSAGYRLNINPEDTNSLSFGVYAFDVELVGPGLKQTTIGQLTLTPEATWAENEG